MAERIDASTLDIQEKLVEINRVAKVVKGGRTFRFSALMVVGDGNGHVGCGKRSGVGRTDYGRTAQSFYGRQTPYQSILFKHARNRKTERNGYNCRKAFRNCRNGK